MEFNNAVAWEQRKLGEIANSFEYGLNASSKTYDGENKYIRITDIDESSHVFNQDNLTSPDISLDNLNHYLLEEGDILLARTGASTGKSYCYNKIDGKVFFAGFLIRAKIKHEYNVSFIFQSTLTERYNNFIQVTSQRSGQPGINAQEYARFALYIPKLKEQQKTGDFFKQLDNTIALHQRKLEKIKALKTAYLSEMFPAEGETKPKRRFGGFTDDWEQRKFIEIINRLSKTSNSSILPKVEYEDIIAEEGRLNKDISNKFDSRKGILFQPKNILYGKLRPYLKNWLYPDFKGVAVGDFWVFEAIEATPRFIYNLIQSDSYQKVANDTAGTKMPRSDWTKVSNSSFFIPKESSEQKRIGTFFKQLDDTIALHQRKLQKLQNIKKAYLNEMFI